MISDGELHLSAAAMLAPLLTSENHQRVLQRACGKSEDEIARLVAALDPKKGPKERIRIVAALAMPDVSAPPTLPQPVDSGTDLFGQPIAELDSPQVQSDIYDFRFAASKATVEMLARAKEILRHRFPDGDADAVIGLALSELLDRYDRDRRKSRKRVTGGPGANPTGPTERSRHIPEAVKQAVHERDGGRCTFVGSDGVRCGSRAWLEYDHRVPFALGGASDRPEGLRQYCRAHNQLAGRRTFGGPHPRRE